MATVTGRTTTMKAMIYHDYGTPEVLTLQEIAVPAIKDHEVLVRVLAAGVDPGVWYFLRGQTALVRVMAGLFRPRRAILGRALAGRVAAIGRAVTEWRPGDEVFAEIDGGAYAEYVAAPAAALARKPANLTFEQAAAVPLSAVTALQGLRDKGRLQPGHHVLINGASGGVGTFAVQIAKAFGASVTGVCGTRNVELVRSLGADQVIDYTGEDFTQGGPRYDLILDLVGNHSLAACRRALTPTGTLVLAGGPPAAFIRRMIAALAQAPFVSRKMVVLAATASKPDLDALRDLIEAGAVRPVIDRAYRLSETPDALRHQGAGHARGKTVITI